MEIEGCLRPIRDRGRSWENRKPEIDQLERLRMLDQIITDMLAALRPTG